MVSFRVFRGQYSLSRPEHQLHGYTYIAGRAADGDSVLDGDGAWGAGENGLERCPGELVRAGLDEVAGLASFGEAVEGDGKIVLAADGYGLDCREAGQAGVGVVEVVGVALEDGHASVARIGGAVFDGGVGALGGRGVEVEEIGEGGVLDDRDAEEAFRHGAEGHRVLHGHEGRRAGGDGLYEGPGLEIARTFDAIGQAGGVGEAFEGQSEVVAPSDCDLAESREFGAVGIGQARGETVAEEVRDAEVAQIRSRSALRGIGELRGGEVDRAPRAIGGADGKDVARAGAAGVRRG